MFLIDELAYRSKLSNVDPAAKIIFGVVPMASCLFWNTVSVSMSVIIIMAILTIKCSGISLLKYIRSLAIPLGFLAVGTVTIIFSESEPGALLLVGFGILGRTYGVTVQSLGYGLQIILKALGAVSCMYFISVNTPMTDILGALRVWGVSELLIQLMELMYRYIFVFFEEIKKIRTTQDSRLGYVDLKTGVNSAGQLIGVLFLRVYVRSDRIYEALQSRGYEGKFKTIKKDYAPSGRFYIYCALWGFILAMLGIFERGFI